MRLVLTLWRDNGVIECQTTVNISKEKAPVAVFEAALRAAEEEAVKPTPRVSGVFE